MQIPVIKAYGRKIGMGYPTYFIADIAANHDGNLKRAKMLIRIAKESGADAAKFQNFVQEKIVSAEAFDSMGKQLSHQSKWKKSVAQVYRDATLPGAWTEELKETCDKYGIDYFSAPYDKESVDLIAPFSEIIKIGSGDITWLEILEYIARKKKAVILSTGASELSDVIRAVKCILKYNKQLLIMQCNTNYTGSLENFKYINLNVLKTYAKLFPNCVLGLSDHTPGHATVLGAVALGARAIEKHFTDDTSRPGPDHPFSMDPKGWAEMVAHTRELENALGDGVKRIEGNEKDTAVVQRRCLRAARPIRKGESIKAADINVLRPAGGLEPYLLNFVAGKNARRNIAKGEAFTRDNV